MASMFERYGGFAKVNQIVSEFYGRVMQSAIMAPYFEGIDMRRQIDHQTKFIASIMGGPASYSDDELHRKHVHLKIDRQAFDEMVELLTETMEDFGMTAEDVAEIDRQVRERARHIITR